jgi:hypothetical protein
MAKVNIDSNIVLIGGLCITDDEEQKEQQLNRKEVGDKTNILILNQESMNTYKVK